MLLPQLFEAPGAAQCEEQGNDTEYAEGTIDKAPPNRNAANCAKDEGIRNYEKTGDDAEVNDPNVAEGIVHWANERNSDHEMTKGEPVGAVKHEGVAGVRVENAGVNAAHPFENWRSEIQACGDPVDEVGLGDERDGGGPADDQADDNDGKPEAYPTQFAGGLVGCRTANQ